MAVVEKPFSLSWENNMLLPYYDIFISYAVEDRKVVEDLAATLVKQGLKVWYTKEHLKAGAGIYDTVSYGLVNSNYGLALISPDYYGRWTHGELFDLQKRKKKLIPVLHGLSIEKGIEMYPELADMFILQTDQGIPGLAEEIGRKVKKRSNFLYTVAVIFDRMRRRRKGIVQLSGMGSLGILLILLLIQFLPASVPEVVLENAVNKRVLAYEGEIRKNLQEKLLQSGARKSSYEELLAFQQICLFSEARYERNRISFSNGQENFSSLAGLKNSGVIDQLSRGEAPFGLAAYRVYIITEKRQKDSCELQFILVNEYPSGYKIEEKDRSNEILKVLVHYSEPLRYAEVKIQYSVRSGILTRTTRILGFKRKENYLFVQKNNEWICTSVR